MPLVEFLNNRLQTLDGHLTILLTLLKEYELALIFEDDPLRKMKFTREIEQVKNSTLFYRKEYTELQQELEALNLTQGVDQEVDTIYVLSLKIDQMQKTLLGELHSMRSELVRQYSAGEQAIVLSIIEHFDQGQLLLIEELMKVIAQNQVTESELADLTLLLQNALKELPLASIPQQEQLKKVLADPKVGLTHKLKISLPIIPAILSYEIELNQKADLGNWVKNHLPQKYINRP